MLRFVTPMHERAVHCSMGCRAERRPARAPGRSAPRGGPHRSRRTARLTRWDELRRRAAGFGTGMGVRPVADSHGQAALTLLTDGGDGAGPAARGAAHNDVTVRRAGRRATVRGAGGPAARGARGKTRAPPHRAGTATSGPGAERLACVTSSGTRPTAGLCCPCPRQCPCCPNRTCPTACSPPRGPTALSAAWIPTARLSYVKPPRPIPADGLAGSDRSRSKSRPIQAKCAVRPAGRVPCGRPSPTPATMRASQAKRKRTNLVSARYR